MPYLTPTEAENIAHAVLERRGLAVTATAVSLLRDAALREPHGPNDNAARHNIANAVENAANALSKLEE
jgi:hypothetical protein